MADEKIGQVYIWILMTTGLLCNVDLRHQYGISVAESQTSPAAKSKEKLACVAGVRKGRGRGSHAPKFPLPLPLLPLLTQTTETYIPQTLTVL